LAEGITADEIVMGELRVDERATWVISAEHLLSQIRRGDQLGATRR
jgi:hypothetical protein